MEQTRVVARVVMVALTVGVGCGGNSRAVDDAANNVVDAHAVDARLDAHTADARLDAPVDAAPDARPVGTVTARFYHPPVFAGQTVIFQHVDGSVAAIRTTDADGYARAELESGGSVTVLYPNAEGGPPKSAATTIGVEPGDEIWHGRKGVEAGPLVHFVVPPPYLSVGVTSSCHEGFSGEFVTWPASCPRLAGIISAWLEGVRDAVFAYVPAMEKPASGVVDLTGIVFHAVEPATVHFINIPPQIQKVGGFIYLSDSVATQHFWAPNGLANVVAGRADVSMPYARVPGTFPAAITSFSDGTHSSSVAFSLTDTDHDVDVSAAVMPKVISTPVLDAVHEIVSWNETEWGHAAGVVVQVEFARGIGRNVMAPHTATSLRIPNLPPPWDYFNVQATDTAANMRVYLMTDSDGYRGVRNWISRSGGYFSLHQPGGFFGNWFY